MGKMDQVTKAYMRDNRVFADVVNFYFYGGEPHVDPTYRSLDRKTFRLIRNVLDSRIAIPEGRGKVDMCKAIDDLIAQGEERGIEKNQNEMFERILGMFRQNILTLVQAAECLGMSEAEFKVKAGL